MYKYNFYFLLLFQFFIFSPFLHAESVIEEGSSEEIIEEFRNQNQEFFRLATGEGKDLEITYKGSIKRDFSGPSDASLFEDKFLFSAEIPIPLSKDFFWRVAPIYEVSFIDFQNLRIDDKIYDSEQLHRLELGLGFGQFLNDNLLFSVMLQPGLHSNFSSIDSQHFQLYSQGYLVYRINENLELIGGAASTELFDEVALFPIIGVRGLVLNQKLHIKFTPPIELRVGYPIADGVQLYAGIWLTGDEYRVERLGRTFKIQTQDLRTGVGVLRWINDHLNLQFEAGWNLESTFDFELVKTNSRSDRLDESPYFRLTIGYAL